ncbi:Hydroxyproline-rich glycoprotein [Rhynchospora pubera]|uniref:Hydroxyproline-rich glycoprotein n=1 Tax=Rhynchospora pubera TaxID=906938 RepID=A0AAV8E8I3_9POAL|nr:Hydroxyproline-rich glycoprotein [Rhynchospora pubera]
MEADMEIISVNYPKRERQQISVPFMWETKPGTLKRDWISKPVSLISYPPPSPSPSKLVVSVPFQWEEEPGKPLTQLPPQPYDATNMNLLTESSCSWNPFLAGGDDYSIGFDLDNFNNPFVSGPTLPDIPITEEKDEPLLLQSMDEEDSNCHENIDSLSQTEQYSSSGSSITTENGASSNGFDMELLFALSSPEVSFLGNLLEKNGDDKLGPVGRRELTLGELIMLSRKLSCRNKPQIVHKKNPSKELIRKILVTCL